MESSQITNSYYKFFVSDKGPKNQINISLDPSCEGAKQDRISEAYLIYDNPRDDIVAYFRVKYNDGTDMQCDFELTPEKWNHGESSRLNPPCQPEMLSAQRTLLYEMYNYSNEYGLPKSGIHSQYRVLLPIIKNTIDKIIIPKPTKSANINRPVSQSDHAESKVTSPKPPNQSKQQNFQKQMEAEYESYVELAEEIKSQINTIETQANQLLEALNSKLQSIKAALPTSDPKGISSSQGGGKRRSSTKRSRKNRRTSKKTKSKRKSRYSRKR